MEEVIKHSLGICGENHPSLITLPAIIIAFAGYYSYIKYKVKTKIKSLWNKQS